MDKNLIGIISPAPLCPGTSSDTPNYSEFICNLLEKGCDVVLICTNFIEVVNQIQHWPVGMIVRKDAMRTPSIKTIFLKVKQSISCLIYKILKFMNRIPYTGA